MLSNFELSCIYILTKKSKKIKILFGMYVRVCVCGRGATRGLRAEEG